jgi:hypothetical protein
MARPTVKMHATTTEAGPAITSHTMGNFHQGGLLTNDGFSGLDMVTPKVLLILLHARVQRGTMKVDFSLTSTWGAAPWRSCSTKSVTP